MSAKKYDEDQTLKVRCVVICQGTMISWYKDGHQLSSSDPRVNITGAAENGRTWTNLVVERLTTNDSGTYTCRARDCFSGQPMNASEYITVNGKLCYKRPFHSFWRYPGKIDSKFLGKVTSLMLGKFEEEWHSATSMNYRLMIPAKSVEQSHLRNEVLLRKTQIKIFIFHIFVCKTKQPFMGKLCSVWMKN